MLLSSSETPVLSADHQCWITQDVTSRCKQGLWCALEPSGRDAAVFTVISISPLHCVHTASLIRSQKLQALLGANSDAHVRLFTLLLGNKKKDYFGSSIHRKRHRKWERNVRRAVRSTDAFHTKMAQAVSMLYSSLIGWPNSIYRSQSAHIFYQSI